ncbi:unnamed protein product [Lymnaea stagnalis]|uniref:Glypican-6 n=1 Tax=Lymnaea stagnalis TaxID=6523 RepID=A0AAV2IDS1_LYMST
MADAGWISLAQCFKACVLFLVVSFGQCQTLNTACIEVKKAYTEKGLDENEVPIKAMPGSDLTICPHTETCCTRGMEDKLTSLSRKEHSKQMDESLKLLKTTFASRTKKFDEFFTALLDKAKRELHEMFLQTYGLLYQQNAAIFSQLFDDLRSYYKGKDMNLVEIMDNFFSKLLQKMFELLNVNYHFDESYLNCVTERMNDLKPFGEVPQKLSHQVKRAFIAARTFVQGLAIGRDIVSTIMDIAPSEACLKATVRMMYCPLCRGLTSTKPCNNFCLNTMKGCLAYQADLNVPWNEYIESLNKVAQRLEGPFNFETVMDPIDVKISEAIMNFQENANVVSTKIFTGCGTPRLARKRRDAQTETETQKHTFEFVTNGTKPNRGRPTTAAGTSLDRLVRDIKDKVKTAKDFWVQLPYVVCNNEQVAAAASKEDDCWNGQDRARYLPEVQKDGSLHQINNPEVDVDVTKSNTVISRQKVQLQLISTRLNNAYSGEDVDWIDTEDSDSSGSGSGDLAEGSASGERVTEEQVNGSIDIDNQPTTKKPVVRRPSTEKPKTPATSKPEDPDKNRTGGKNNPKFEDKNGGSRGSGGSGGKGSGANVTLSLGLFLFVLSLHCGLRQGLVPC